MSRKDAMDERIGNQIQWDLIAHGVAIPKAGVIAFIVPPGYRPGDIVDRTPAEKYPLRAHLDTPPRDSESCLVAVPGNRK